MEIKRKCSHPGCRNVVVSGRCDKHAGQMRRPLDRRQSASERGYDKSWTELAAMYRREHPLCVMCLSKGRITAATCVDHIVPVRCCPDLRMEWDNLQASCTRCNWRKAQTDPDTKWEPRADRIVVCGLPGTGKTTYAKTTGLKYWDADEHEYLRTAEDVQRARSMWINSRGNEGYCIIVASTITASRIAARIRGRAKHMTEVYVERGESKYVTAQNGRR